MDPHRLPDPSTVTPSVVLQLEHFSEGPLRDADGSFYISSPPGGYVLKSTHVLEGTGSGQFVTWTRAPRANGHKILADGTHLLCHGDHVLRLDAAGRADNRFDELVLAFRLGQMEAVIEWLDRCVSA